MNGDQTFGLPIFGETYPVAPGFAHDSVISRAAAEAIGKELRALHRQVLAVFARRDMTPDACADVIRTHWIRVRPRCCELCKPEWGCLLEETGEVGVSAMGNDMAILRITEAGRKYLADVSKSAHGDNTACEQCAKPNELAGAVS